MDETHPPRRILQSVGAVLAGFFATFILSIATDVVLHAIGVLRRGVSRCPMRSSLRRRPIARSTPSQVATSRRASRPTARWHTSLGARYYRLGCGPCGHDGNVERRPGIRAEVVSPRARRARVTFCLGGRQTCAARDSRELVSIASESGQKNC